MAFFRKLSSASPFCFQPYFIAVLFFAIILSACGDDESPVVGSDCEYGLPSNESNQNGLNDPYSIYWVGSFSGPEKINNPEYLWVYYNTTDGCSYIYTQSGWNLFAGQGCNGHAGSTSGASVPNPSKRDTIQISIPVVTDTVYDDGKNGVDGKDGKDGRDGVDGKDGRDGVDGKDGQNGRDGVDGKDGKDGRDGVDGKDGSDGIVFVKSAEETENGITYDVKSYALLEAGNPYFYTYYKFYFVEDVLAKTYVCYRTTSNLNSPLISYLDFTEANCKETSYTKTYSSEGYVTSSVQQVYSLNTEIKSISVYYPSSTVVHYLAQYQGGKLISAVEYDRGGNIISTDSATVIASIEKGLKSETSSVGTSDSAQTFAVESITLSRYHILNTDKNRNITATFVVNDLSLVDTTGGIYVQVINSNQDTVYNFRPESISNDTIKAVVKAPAISGVSYYGSTYSVHLKIGGNVYKNWKRKFNVSSSYVSIAFATSSASKISVNVDESETDSISIPIAGSNMDFVESMYIKVLDSTLVQIDSVGVDLTPTQWLNDECSNYQTVYRNILTPQKEGTYYLELYVDGKKYNSSSFSLIVYKNPYFTSFEIPYASIDNASSYVNATVKGKNFEMAGLDISLFGLKFSKEYETIDSLKYEAAVVNDTLIALKIFIPDIAGEYKISAYYDKEQIDSKFTVVGSCTQEQEDEIVQVKDSYKICKSGLWEDATFFERDIYRKTCSKDGAIEDGSVVRSNKYVCDADTFRIASELEIRIGLGCVSYNDGKTVLYEKGSLSLKSDYICENGSWKYSSEFDYGILIDKRDGQLYKTILVGGKTWMAENLNYADSINYPSMQKRNWCYGNNLDSCGKYGRLYTWAAATDSVRSLFASDKDSEKTTVQGICPDGWHLPSEAEWTALIDSLGGLEKAGVALKSASDWNGTDAYGFSSLPAGYKYSISSFSSVGSQAVYWSATEDGLLSAKIMYLYTSSDNAYIDARYKTYGYSVRCVEDGI